MRVENMKIANKQTEKGFTLVEMAIVILIMGLVVGSVFAFLDVQQEQKHLDVTKGNQKKIAVALAIYAQNNGRLPCPATHRIVSSDANYGRSTATTCNGVDLKGIVPFRELGLEVTDIVDGYNNALTYVVSSNLVTAPVTTGIHRNCRTSAIWISAPLPPALGTNYNPIKASFCCQQEPTVRPLQVFNNRNLSNGAIVTPTQSKAGSGTGASAGNFGNVDDALTGPVAEVVTQFAYVLISHGKNGDGAFILPSDDIRHDDPRDRKVPGEIEAENDNRAIADNDMNFIAIPINSSAGNDHFDDIVFWRTQQQVIGQMGNDSCSIP